MGGVCTAAIFANVPDNLAGVQNRAGCLFFTLTFFAFGSMTSIDLFMSERAVFSREQRGKYYRVGTYFISKALLDGLLLRVMPAVLYGVIVYWLVGVGVHQLLSSVWRQIHQSFRVGRKRL